MTQEKSVDVLIVGGGSAGAVLAARLSEDPARRVTLVEAGPVYPPDGYPPSVSSSNVLGGATGHDWGTISEPGVVGHSVALYRGKVLGGGSAVNGAIAVRATQADFARWNIAGWSFDDVLPAFKALENADGGSDQWHGRSGPLPVHQLDRTELSTMQRAFVDAALATGIPAAEDFNGPKPSGVGPYPMNIVDGVRVNTGMAYLTESVRSRPNLTILGDHLVDRVLTEGGRAVGVLLAGGTQLRAAEVVLSAGAIGTPAILLRSGIGPAAHLTALGIDVVADLPVGQTLYDHPFYHNVYAAKPDVIGEPTPVLGAKVWTASSEAIGDELDLHIVASHVGDQSVSPTGAAFLLSVGLVRPVSSGTLTLTSIDPHTDPRVDLNLLAESTDSRRMAEGIALARHIAAASPLADLIDHELNPGSMDVDASIKSTVNSYHHYSSTTPMGTVVDPLGVVFGVEGLRVVDASIFPDVPSAAIHLTVLMAAEHIAAELAPGRIQ